MFVWIAEIVLFIFGLMYILSKGFSDSGKEKECGESVSDADDVKSSRLHFVSYTLL